MEHTSRVCVCDCVGDGDYVWNEARATFKRDSFLDDCGERPPCDELHRIVGSAIGPSTSLIHRHDARMFESRCDQSLAQKAEFIGLVSVEELFHRNGSP